MTHVWRQYGDHAGCNGNVYVSPLIYRCVCHRVIYRVVQHFHTRRCGDLHRAEILGSQNFLRLLHRGWERLRCDKKYKREFFNNKINL